MTDGRDRRSVLRACAALCSFAVAGCLGDGSEKSAAGDENTRKNPGESAVGNDTAPVEDGTGPDGNETEPGGNETRSDDEPDEDPGDSEDLNPVTSWPMQQYDRRNTSSVEAAPPREDVQVSWEEELDGTLDSSPVVGDETVYLVDTDGRAYAIGKDGGRKWTRDLPQSGHFATPAVWEDLLITPREKGITALRRSDGSTVWSYDTERSPTDVTVGEGVVTFGTDHKYLYCLDARSGGEEWIYQPEIYDLEDFAHAPIIHDGEIIVHDQDYETIALSVEDGEKRIIKAHDRAIRSPLSLNDGTLYCGSNDGVEAFDFKTGEHLWHYPTAHPMETGLAVHEECVYGVALWGEHYNLFALDAAEGTERWRKESYGSISTGPLAVGDIVVKGKSFGGVVAFDTESGDRVWTVDTTLGSYHQGAYAEGAFYLGIKQVLYRISSS